MKNGFLNVLRQVKSGLRSGATLTLFFLVFAIWFMVFLKWGIPALFGGALAFMGYTHWMKTKVRRNARGSYQPDSREDADYDHDNRWNDDEHGAGVEIPSVNPATGLLMIGGIGGFDSSGNPFGVDLHSTSHDDTSWHHSSGHDFGSSTNDW